MKPRSNLAIAFVLGLVLGLIPAVLIYLNTQWLMGSFYCMGLTEMSMNAGRIRAGKSEAVLAAYENALPDTVVNVNSLFRSNPNATCALWAAQRFYEENPGSTLTPEAKKVLSSLPPRPPTTCARPPKTSG